MWGLRAARDRAQPSDGLYPVAESQSPVVCFAGDVMSELESVEDRANLAPAATVPRVVPPERPPVSNVGDCPTCGGGIGSSPAPSFVYAIGRIEPRFPQLSVEKEFARSYTRFLAPPITATLRANSVG
jgi:hypothetical protein